MFQHLPALQIVIPLLAAPLCLLLYNARISWWIAMAASTTAWTISCLLLQQTLDSGAIIYHMGGWATPWGIEYHVDIINSFVLLIVSSISTLVLLYARKGISREIQPQQTALFYTTYLLCLTGLLGITITGDAFNLFVFLEISSLSSYTLISMGKDRRALTASYQYLILGTIGATFILIGIGLLYMMTGTLNMADLAQRLPEMSGIRTLRVALAFLTVGLSLKLALFPLHLWLPNAYTYAPSAVSAFIAATATKVAVYALLRFMFTVFGVEFSFSSMSLDRIMMPLALIAILSASLVAMFQDNIKRMLAYSSVAQIGYVVVGICLVSASGLTASIVHLFNHAIMKGALFMAIGCIVYRLGSSQLSELSGIGRTMPWSVSAIIIAGISLIGVPLTVGFISKWYLVAAALEQDRWLIALVVLLGSLIALIYIWRMVETMYFQPAAKSDTTMREAPLSLLLPTWVLVIANVYFGIHTDLTLTVAGRAAEALLKGAP